MKRFYREASLATDAGGHAVRLDGRPVRTPAGAALAVPGAALAGAIVAEWNAQGDTIVPATMPMTGFANAMIDRLLPALADFRAQIGGYGASDLLCYRAAGPAPLVERQCAAWDPLLRWASDRLDIALVVTSGLMPVDQPAAALARLRAAVEAIDPWLLAGAAVLVPVSGTLIGTLALLDGAIDGAALWAAADLDEAWQAEHWGEDAEAAGRRERRRADLMAACRYCALVMAG